MATYQELAEKLLEQEISKEVLDLKLKILQKIAEENDVKPTCMPAPKNITELGGYYNLLAKLEKEKTEMRMKMIASVLGIPQQPIWGLDEALGIFYNCEYSERT